MEIMLRWSLACLLAIACPAAHAEIVELTLPNKLVARADFRQGEPSKPAVLLVHGFLQTHSFPTISRLADNLASESYTVLAPTVSLGVTHRNQSLACEAIHTHTVSSGVEEIAQWVKWLKAHKATRIVLAGHSMGNVYNLAYMSRSPDPAIYKLVGVSIVEGALKSGEAARPALVQKLRAMEARHGREMVEEQFSFCQKYRSTPAGLLSYVEWGPEHIIEAINKLKVPVSMIMGSRDDRLGKDWLPRLKKSHARVVIIEGANHFMDGQYEFDLIDQFLLELKSN